jgi:hypothetical protein
MPSPLLVTFRGATAGQWRIARANAVVGAPLASATHLAIHEGPTTAATSAWELRGVTSHQRYVTRDEADALLRSQAGLGRPEATRAALIPIRKSDAWWSLGQDERRAIFEERSKHVSATMRFLPAIARRLHHSRDLGEPFDFLTWFEYAPEHQPLFDDLVAMLRASEEWKYVEREVDVRLER